MNKPKRRLGRILSATLTSLALFATACGGGASSAENAAAATTAEANELQLQLTSDIASSQLLDASDGTISTLADEITGDRPVLVWYWAPH